MGLYDWSKFFAGFWVCFLKASAANTCLGEGSAKTYSFWSGCTLCILACACFVIPSSQKLASRAAQFWNILQTLQGDCLHSFERIPDLEVTAASEAEEKSIGAEFDVVAHLCWGHPNQFHWESINDEFHCIFNCATHDLDDPWFWKPLDQLRVQETHKVSVQPLVAADQFLSKTNSLASDHTF